jgi:hypothetical protein
MTLHFPFDHHPRFHQSILSLFIKRKKYHYSINFNKIGVARKILDRFLSLKKKIGTEGN